MYKVVQIDFQLYKKFKLVLTNYTNLILTGRSAKRTTTTTTTVTTIGKKVQTKKKTEHYTEYLDC